jgi:xylan 1,4-beta-xylosidase
MKSSVFHRWSFGAILLSAWVGAISPAMAQVQYENPVVAGDHPDPSVIRVGKDYWATATSSEWGPQFPLLHSTDLVNWEDVGPAFAHRPDWAVGNFWAPEIAEYKGKYYIYYVGREKGGPLAISVATADKPSGPYTDHGPLVAQDAGSIDPVPVTGERGERYLVWKEDGNSRQIPTVIWAQKLNADGTKLEGERKELIRNDSSWEKNLVEGPFILRRGDWFYMFYSGSGCCGNGCDYALGVARSHSLLGPWEKDPANPILAGNVTWKCPGHGSIVSDERGRYWLLYHAYSTIGTVFTGREALLDEVKFGSNDWPTINDGKGPSAKAASPYGMVQRKAEVSFTDDFKGEKLRAGYQWPQDNEPTYKIKNDELILVSNPDRGTNVIGSVLARSTTAADYVAETALNLADLKPGSMAGLAAFGDMANAVGLAAKDGKLVLWRCMRGKTEILATVDAPSCEKLHLRYVAKNGAEFQFATSNDGEKWISVGEKLIGRFLPPWDRSVRVALTVGGSQNAAAKFSSLRIIPEAASLHN